MRNREKFRKWMPVFGVLFIGLVFATGWVVMSLWNAILPVVLGIKLISYWQAMGILVLSRILFGRIGFGGMHRRPGFGNRAFRDRFLHATEEEKEQMKEELEKRCR